LSAPHQPRLDWQMWFAALGHYKNNPWLVHLVYKLLIGERDGKWSAVCWPSDIELFVPFHC